MGVVTAIIAGLLKITLFERGGWATVSGKTLLTLGGKPDYQRCACWLFLAARPRNVIAPQAIRTSISLGTVSNTH